MEGRHGRQVADQELTAAAAAAGGGGGGGDDAGIEGLVRNRYREANGVS